MNATLMLYHHSTSVCTQSSHGSLWQAHRALHRALIPVFDVEAVAVGHLQLVATVGRDHRRSNAKVRLASTNHIGVHGVFASLVEIDGADMKWLMDITHHAPRPIRLVFWSRLQAPGWGLGRAGYLRSA